MEGEIILSYQQMSIVAMKERHIPAISDLIMAQEQRFSILDPRLKRFKNQRGLNNMLSQQRQYDPAPFVIMTPQGHVGAFVKPALWEIPAESGQRAFFSARNGIAHHLTLPDLTNKYTPALASALLQALHDYWQTRDVACDIIHWPNCDSWLEPILKRFNFVLATELAYYPPAQVRRYKNAHQEGLHTRLAQPGDEELLVRLFEEELRYHLPFTPFVHVDDAILRAFRARLARLWAGEDVETGAPCVVVVEKRHEVVAMAECDLYNWGESDAGFLSPGRYIHISNASVRSDQRGQGIGHFLVGAIFSTFATLQNRGYILWYNPDNPSSSTFWRKIGFRPLWKTYHRLHTNAANPAYESGERLLANV